MQAFDTYIAIDWSGAEKPQDTKAIAVAKTTRGTDAPILLQPPIGAYWSRTTVAAFIESLAKSGKRTLVGVDCNFGYAQAVATAQLGNNYTGPDLWAYVEQHCAHTSNFFARDFWQAPHIAPYFWASGPQHPRFKIHRRITEIQCGSQGYGWPESPFKLIGAKQVGKGGLAGMRMAHALTQNKNGQIGIWPFMPQTTEAPVVITEIYPRLFIRRAQLGNLKIRDINTLNIALAAFQSAPITHMPDLSDHVTDALVAAAGLRHACGVDATLPAAITSDVTTLYPEAMREGWIFGLPAC